MGTTTMSDEHFQARAVRVGHEYEARVVEWVDAQGWSILGRKIKHPSGIEIDILAVDLAGERVGIECKGGEVDGRSGLQRSDNIWKVLGQTLVLHNWNRAHRDEQLRFLCITSAQPLDGERLAEPLRVAEANGQLTIVVVP
jgi:Holliday junction resolvase-like predicted endonuclease